MHMLQFAICKHNIFRNITFLRKKDDLHMWCDNESECILFFQVKRPNYDNVLD